MPGALRGDRSRDGVQSVSSASTALVSSHFLALHWRVACQSQRPLAPPPPQLPPPPENPPPPPPPPNPPPAPGIHPTPRPPNMEKIMMTNATIATPPAISRDPAMNQPTTPATPAPMAEPPILPTSERKRVPTTAPATSRIINRFP